MSNTACMPECGHVHWLLEPSTRQPPRIQQSFKQCNENICMDTRVWGLRKDDSRMFLPFLLLLPSYAQLSWGLGAPHSVSSQRGWNTSFWFLRCSGHKARKSQCWKEKQTTCTLCKNLRRLLGHSRTSLEQRWSGGMSWPHLHCQSSHSGTFSKLRFFPNSVR